MGRTCGECENYQPSIAHLMYGANKYCCTETGALARESDPACDDFLIFLRSKSFVYDPEIAKLHETVIDGCVNGFRVGDCSGHVIGVRDDG